MVSDTDVRECGYETCDEWCVDYVKSFDSETKVYRCLSKFCITFGYVELGGLIK